MRERAPGPAVRVLDLLDRAARAVIFVTMTGMVAVVSTQVVLRYGFNLSLDWGEDLARLLFVWSIFLAIPLAVRVGAHIGIDLLVGALPAVVQRRLRSVMAALAAVMMFVVSYQAALLVRDQWDENMPTLELSVALFLVPVCVGAAHSALHLLHVVVAGRPAAVADPPA